MVRRENAAAAVSGKPPRSSHLEIRRRCWRERRRCVPKHDHRHKNRGRPQIQIAFRAHRLDRLAAAVSARFALQGTQRGGRRRVERDRETERREKRSIGGVARRIRPIVRRRCVALARRRSRCCCRRRSPSRRRLPSTAPRRGTSSCGARWRARACCSAASSPFSATCSRCTPKAGCARSGRCTARGSAACSACRSASRCCRVRGARMAQRRHAGAARLESHRRRHAAHALGARRRRAAAHRAARVFHRALGSARVAADGAAVAHRRDGALLLGVLDLVLVALGAPVQARPPRHAPPRRRRAPAAGPHVQGGGPRARVGRLCHLWRRRRVLGRAQGGALAAGLVGVLGGLALTMARLALARQRTVLPRSPPPSSSPRCSSPRRCSPGGRSAPPSSSTASSSASRDQTRFCRKFFTSTSWHGLDGHLAGAREPLERLVERALLLVSPPLLRSARRSFAPAVARA